MSEIVQPVCNAPGSPTDGDRAARRPDHPQPGRRTRSRRHRAIGLGAVLAVALLAGACAKDEPGGGGGSAATTPATVAPVGVDYSARGPYPVGRQILSLGDREVVVYYPADPEATKTATHLTSYSSGEAFTPELRQTVAGLVPEFVQDISIDAYADVKINAEGPFPIVLHSHGAGGYYLFESTLLTHLASWGYVAAAPDHKSRNLSSAVGTRQTDPDDVTDLRNTLALLERENVSSSSPLAGGLDVERVAAEGHSAGGRAVAVLAADPTSGVDTFVGIEPAAPVPASAMGERGGAELSTEERIARTREGLAGATKPAVPSLIVQGDRDGIIPLAVVQAEYDWLAPPKQLVVVAGAGHNISLDICARIREQGGLMKYQDKLPAFAGLFRLGEDGCTPDNLDPAKGLAIVEHLTVAQYRWVFGQDADRASLTDEFLTRTFGPAIADVQFAP